MYAKYEYTALIECKIGTVGYLCNRKLTIFAYEFTPETVKKSIKLTPKTMEPNKAIHAVGVSRKLHPKKACFT